jgi:hypothetical protein
MINRRPIPEQERPPEATPHPALTSLNIDTANISPYGLERLLEMAPTLGRIVVAHAFSDWKRDDMGDLAILLFRAGFRLIHCPSWPSGGVMKSVTDDVMAQDLRDQLEVNEDVEVYVLATGDRNFIAVANALKRHGKQVYVAAEERSLSRELGSLADRLILLDPPPGTVMERPAAAAYPGWRTPAGPPPRGRAREPRSERAPEPIRVTGQVSGFSDEEIIQMVATLNGHHGEAATMRRVVKALVPEDPSGRGEARSRLANQIANLIAAGRLRIEKVRAFGAEVEALVPTEGVAPGRTAGRAAAEERAPGEERTGGRRRRGRGGRAAGTGVAEPELAAAELGPGEEAAAPGAEAEAEPPAARSRRRRRGPRPAVEAVPEVEATAVEPGAPARAESPPAPATPPAGPPAPRPPLRFEEFFPVSPPRSPAPQPLEPAAEAQAPQPVATPPEPSAGAEPLAPTPINAATAEAGPEAATGGRSRRGRRRGRAGEPEAPTGETASVAATEDVGATSAAEAGADVTSQPAAGASRRRRGSGTSAGEPVTAGRATPPREEVVGGVEGEPASAPAGTEASPPGDAGEPIARRGASRRARTPAEATAPEGGPAGADASGSAPEAARPAPRRPRRRPPETAEMAVGDDGGVVDQAPSA